MFFDFLYSNFHVGTKNLNEIKIMTMIPTTNERLSRDKLARNIVPKNAPPPPPKAKENVANKGNIDFLK